ncbi:hypothetical protein RhiirA5_408253 [Rhizophagus irregularis]|uniref:Uncharacterized protein n=1 Tax=Rhizophagus irregularis TaxID=588596 RepID=A0A2N0Q8G4_9GLOM|nr:hypothetical protein RhiirA5_408253 [Rhizophagus irregularis]
MRDLQKLISFFQLKQFNNNSRLILYQINISLNYSIKVKILEILALKRYTANLYHY